MGAVTDCPVLSTGIGEADIPASNDPGQQPFRFQTFTTLSEMSEIGHSLRSKL